MLKKTEKIQKLLNNPLNEERAKKAFAYEFPNAPEYFISIAVFHACNKGYKACSKWLNSLEDFLETPEKGFDFGTTFELLSHLYNLFLIKELLDKGSTELLESLGNIQFFLKEKDWKGMEDSVEQLENVLGGFRVMPEFRTE
jgi:hypothetical protein